MNTFLKLAIFTLFLIPSKNLFALDNVACLEKQKADIDHSPEFCKPRDQDSIGWCYAYAASDLLTHHLKRKKLINNDCNTRVSAVAVAASYNKDKAAEHREMIKNRLKKQSASSFLSEEANKSNADDREYFENVGGHIKTSIELAVDNGICMESDIPSDDYKYSLAGGCIASESGGCGLKSLINTIYKYKSEGTNLCAAVNASLAIAPNINADAVQKILINMEATEVIDALISASCKKLNYEQTPWWKRITGEGLRLENHSGTPDFENIDKELAAGNAIGISYYSNFILTAPGKGQKKGAHASIIVGKKFDCEQNKEVYIVRNSWGNSCAAFQNTISNFEEIDKCNTGTYTSENLTAFKSEFEKQKLKPEKERDWQYNYFKQALANIPNLKLVTTDEKEKQNKTCNEKWTTTKPINPGVTCKDGLLFIDKSILKESIYGTTNIKE